LIGTSGDFDALVKTTHQHVAKVEVHRDGVLVRTLAVHAGSVDADRNNKLMRRFSASVADPDGLLTPEGIRDLLAPFGTELWLFRGVRIPLKVDNVSRNEEAEDWESGIGWGVTVNGSGYLVMGA